MGHVTRRDFLRTGLAATALAGSSRLLPAFAARKSATDWVTLGNSGVKVTRLALGTGTYGGRVQRDLGQEAFTGLVRHAYDRGIRFFETAESYSGMPEMLGIALKGLPRDSYRLMTKLSTRGDVQDKMDRARQALNTEYIDILLMHCVRSPTWAEEGKAMRDGISEAKSKKVVMVHGVSCHGLQALGSLPGDKWLDVAMIRMNHKGVRMDTPGMGDTNDLGDVPQVVAQARKLRTQGTGILSMKLVGEGQFTNAEDREAALKFVMGQGLADAVTIGYKSPAEIDEAIERLDRALNA
jgi:aryl-alcohol dehydrogenase-like predicted oxidoreductase